MIRADLCPLSYPQSFFRSVSDEGLWRNPKPEAENLIPVKNRMLKLFSSQIPSFKLQLLILKNIVTKIIQYVKGYCLHRINPV